VCVAVRATGGIHFLLIVADILQCVVAVRVVVCIAMPVRVVVCIAMPFIAGCNRRSFHQVDILKKYLALKFAQ
jgi:uncharacterized membrane protein affecting hemolysin expression